VTIFESIFGAWRTFTKGNTISVVRRAGAGLGSGVFGGGGEGAGVGVVVFVGDGGGGATSGVFAEGAGVASWVFAGGAGTDFAGSSVLTSAGAGFVSG